MGRYSAAEVVFCFCTTADADLKFIGTAREIRAAK